MKQRNCIIFKNPFIRQPDYAITLNLLNEIFDDMYFNTDNELSHLKGYEYLYTLLDYGPWHTAPDIFRYIPETCLGQIRRKQCFFIFDASNEGFSPTGDYAIFDYIYQSCKLHDIDPRMILYVSGNLYDEENIVNYAKQHNTSPINVVSYAAFEVAVSTMEEARDPTSGKYRTSHALYKLAKRQCQDQFDGKLFSSLSRRNRHYRMISTFLLCQEEISKQALISHNKLDQENLESTKLWARTNNVPEHLIDKWASSLPLTIDSSDFEEDWATGSPYEHIPNQTIFQIVNETHNEDFNKTSLFYSEKTFKPVLKCQPFVIYGRKGCNHAIKELGYKTYENWFDLSFDFEEDNILRYKKLLESVKKACAHLNSLSKEEQISWRFKNKGVLLHNCQTLQKSAYSKNKLYQFFKNLRP